MMGSSTPPLYGQSRLYRSFAAGTTAGYLWSAAGVGAATGVFSLLRDYVDKGEASLLFLPVVIACAVRFGFGPAVLGALLSFLCWNYFFLPPYHTLAVSEPKDWLSLFVFLIAAITTGQLASRAQSQATQARAREAEMATLFEASEAIIREISAAQLLAALAGQIQTLCGASRCLVFRRAAEGDALTLVEARSADGEIPDGELTAIRQEAERSYASDQVAGLTDEPNRKRQTRSLLRPEAASPTRQGAFVPLHATDSLVGVLNVGPRDDGQPFSPMEQRLILTLANHAATVIAREGLSEKAAQAAALREADTLKDALLSLVSHELRTPLAAIKASASGLLQRNSTWDEPARREALASIDREADRLTGLVNHMLDLSRLEAGAWRPSKDWCDLSEIIATVLDRLPEANAARIRWDVAPDMPLVRADYIQIALVLENLLENAAKYAPGDSPILIRVQERHEKETSVGIVVQVRDFGEGIAPGEETRLFTRFYRGERHRSGPIHGTGLGLALCEAVIRGHKGHLWAGNAPPDEPPGAVLSFYLPIDAPVDADGRQGG